MEKVKRKKANILYFQTKVNALIESKDNIREEGSVKITQNLKELKPDDIKDLKELISEYLIDGVNNYSDRPFNWVDDDVITVIKINKTPIFKAKVIYTFSSTILELTTYFNNPSANIIEAFENNSVENCWDDSIIEKFVNKYLMISRCIAASY